MLKEELDGAKGDSACTGAASLDILEVEQVLTQFLFGDQNGAICNRARPVGIPATTLSGVRSDNPLSRTTDHAPSQFSTSALKLEISRRNHRWDA
jgi:hypothetical protein